MRQPRARDAAAREPMGEPGAAAGGAAARIARALRASPFEWGDESHEAHFFSLVARLPLVCEFVARVAPFAKPDGRTHSVVAYRVRVQVRGSVLVVRDAGGAAPIVGTVSLAQASLRFVKKGTVAVIPAVPAVTGSAAAHAALPQSVSENGDIPFRADPALSDTAAAAPMASLYVDPLTRHAHRRWWRPALRRVKGETGEGGTPLVSESIRERTARIAAGGFVLELDDHRRFPSIVDALSSAVTVPRPPSLDRFEIIRPLRLAKAASTYLVRDTQSNEMLAMKLVRRCDVAASESMRRVVDERAALERIRGHPFVIDLRHAFMTDTLIVFLFEHCHGGNLEHQLRLRRRGLREREATGVIAQLVLAIEHVHRAGSAVYRDLKPENVLLDSQGWVRLTDFGLCRILDANIETGAASMANLRASMRRSEMEKAAARMDGSKDRAERHSSLVGTRKTNGMSPTQLMHRATSEMNALSRRQNFVLPLNHGSSPPDRPEKLLRSERGRRTRLQMQKRELEDEFGDSTSVGISEPGGKYVAGSTRMSSAITEASSRQNSNVDEQRDNRVDLRDDARHNTAAFHCGVDKQMEQRANSRVCHKPESSSTVTDSELGSGNLPGGPSPRADTLMNENGYRSPEMVHTGKDKASGYGRSADMWSLGVLTHYVLTGTFPFATDANNIPLPQVPPQSMKPKIILSPELPSLEARDFVEGLLGEDPKERLGCGFEGFDEVRMHPWFRSIEWDVLARREGGYALKMLGDTRRSPFDQSEAVEAARGVAGFSGATGVLGLGNQHELLPGALRPEIAGKMSSKRSSSRGLGARRSSTAGARSSGRVRTMWTMRRRSNVAGRALSLAHNVPGGNMPPSDGDVFGFAFSSAQSGFQLRRMVAPRASNAVGLPGTGPWSSSGTSPRLSMGDGKMRRLSRLGRSGRSGPNGSFGGRRSMELPSVSGRGSLDLLGPSSRKSLEAASGRRGSIERAKSGDFLTIEVGDVEIPFRKSLEMAASRRDGVV